MHVSSQHVNSLAPRFSRNSLPWLFRCCGNGAFRGPIAFRPAGVPVAGPGWSAIRQVNIEHAAPANVVAATGPDPTLWRFRKPQCHGVICSQRRSDSTLRCRCFCTSGSSPHLSSDERTAAGTRLGANAITLLKGVVPAAYSSRFISRPDAPDRPRLFSYAAGAAHFADLLPFAPLEFPQQSRSPPKQGSLTM
jgi:hypothetical protein